MEITTVGLDLAKQAFQAHGVDAVGQARCLQGPSPGAQVLASLARLPPCLIGIEACGTSHHWAPEPIGLGPVDAPHPRSAAMRALNSAEYRVRLPVIGNRLVAAR